MSRAVSYVGKRFGRLLAIKKIVNGPSANEVAYLCYCDCGKQATVSYPNLKTGNTKSCGCLNRERIKARKASDFTMRVSEIGRYYRRNARAAGRTWDLLAEEIEAIITSPCHYCGIPAPSVKARGNGKSGLHGIDRIDSHKAYTPDNVVPCCKICNHAKLDLPVDEFKLWVARAYVYQNQTV